MISPQVGGCITVGWRAALIGARGTFSARATIRSIADPDCGWTPQSVGPSSRGKPTSDNNQDLFPDAKFTRSWVWFFSWGQNLTHTLDAQTRFHCRSWNVQAGAAFSAYFRTQAPRRPKAFGRCVMSTLGSKEFGIHDESSAHSSFQEVCVWFVLRF